ncbi:MAG: ribonuclease D [Rhodospirillales bacterium]|nr:ribonuclease D [Rhodospirillales bacterium]
MQIEFHQGDLPANVDFGARVAVDTEAMGLHPHRDRLCLVQLSAGDDVVHLVQLLAGQYDAPNLKKLFTDPAVTKIFHYARFDIALIRHQMGVDCSPIYCTKIASHLARTYTANHGLKDLCREFLGVDLSKQQQQSNWGAETLSEDQMKYAALDVLYLHKLQDMLEEMLIRENRQHLAAACFEFLPHRTALDLAGWPDLDIFAH